MDKVCTLKNQNFNKPLVIDGWSISLNQKVSSIITQKKWIRTL